MQPFVSDKDISCYDTDRRNFAKTKKHENTKIMVELSIFYSEAKKLKIDFYIESTIAH